MKVDRTKYTVHRENGVVVAQWVSIEMSVDEANGENPLAALDRSMELEQQWYKDKALAFPGAFQGGIPPYGSPTPTIQVKPEVREIGVSVSDIMSCQDLVTLDSYRIIIRGKADLEVAYIQRRPELVKKESQQLLDSTNEFYKNASKSKK